MRNFLRRIRGILGLGSVGAVGGALFGAAWGLVELIAPGIVHIPLLYHVVGWSIAGAATAAGFGLLLATTSGRRRLEELGPWRARALGAVAGAVSPILVLTAFAGALPTLGVSLLTGGIGAALGAAVGSGLIAAAQSGESNEQLSSPPDRSALLSGSGPEGAAS